MVKTIHNLSNPDGAVLLYVKQTEVLKLMKNENYFNYRKHGWYW